MEDSLTFRRKFLSALAYTVFIVVTAIAAFLAVRWAIEGDKDREVTMISARLAAENGVRTEYLIGQQFDTAGIYIDIGTEEASEKISAEECEISQDFTCAGNKTVKIIYMKDSYTGYIAEVETTVLYVRNMNISSYPTRVEVDQEGNVTDMGDDFEAYAEFSSKPASDVFGDVTETAGGYRVRLTEDMYTVSCSSDASVSGYHALTLYCGNVSSSFNIFNAAGRSFMVSSASDVVSYKNADGTSSAEMKLVVTERDENYALGLSGTTAGYYVYRDKAGKENALPFLYTLSDTAENMDSNVFGLTENTDGNVYSVSYDGETFTAGAAVFRSAVVGGEIVEDHGFKIVITSEERILRFAYTPADPTDPADPAYNSSKEEATDGEWNEETSPSLTLYVTDYDMNPLLGTGNGWSRGVYIFTDKNGESRKATFYMQSWVWTYVPLSVNYNDVYADCEISDFVYNYEAPTEDLKWNSYYRGTMYATVNFYDRSNGEFEVKTLRFSVPDILDEKGEISVSSEEQWLKATMGM